MTSRGAARLALGSALLLGLLVFVVVLVASIAQSPGLGGIASGIGLGLFSGLLVAVVGAWGAMYLVSTPALPANLALGDVLAAQLAPVLAELEATRVELVRQAYARARWRVPLGVAGGALLWLSGAFLDKPGDVFDLLSNVLVGAIAGYGWAVQTLAARYRSLYKDRVLPALAGRFPGIGYRRAQLPDLAKLQAEHVFDAFDDASAEDELFGTHRGLAISIQELSLHKGSGDDRQIVFSGLIAQVSLPRALAGTTAVIADAGLAGSVRGWLTRSGRDRVRVEDPAFEAIYQVYATDQIAARALLTPAFMERFRLLGQRPGFGMPLALAQGNDLLLALPRWGSALFQPPGFTQNAASRVALVTLYNDIAAVLETVDAVIGLDAAARSVAAENI